MYLIEKHILKSLINFTHNTFFLLLINNLFNKKIQFHKIHQKNSRNYGKNRQNSGYKHVVNCYNLLIEVTKCLLFIEKLIKIPLWQTK